MDGLTTTFTSFSGADIVVYIDGVKVIGELQEIQWTKQLGLSAGLRPIKGTIKTVLFDRECPLMKYENEVFSFLVLYANEYGQRKAEYISGIQLESVSSGVSVDDITQEATYTFTARNVDLIENFPTSGDDKAEWLRNLLADKEIGKLSCEERRKLDIVQRHLLHQITERGWELIHASELNHLRATPQERLTKNFKQQIIRQRYGAPCRIIR